MTALLEIVGAHLSLVDRGRILLGRRSPDAAYASSGSPQRASWLSSLAPTLREAAALVPRDAEGYIAPLDHVLSSYAGLCWELQHAVTVLDPQWSANEALSCAQWEAIHVPESLKEQTHGIEVEVAQMRSFLQSLVPQ